MKRRDFIKATTVAGVSGMIGQGCSTMGKTAKYTGPGFDVHPFVKSHPEAVFVSMTDIKSKSDTDDIRNEGNKLAKELIVKTPSGGYPYSTRITVKPNWTSAGPRDGKPVFEKLGVNTDLNFIEGWVQGMKEVGPQQYFIRECCCPKQWEPLGYVAMCERNGIDLRDLSSMDIWELKKGDLNYIKIPNGVVFDEVAYMAPMNEPNTFLVNIAKMKAHGMGITASIKNLQGLCAHRFHSFCTPHDQVRKYLAEPYQKYFKKGFEKHVEELYAKHLKDGIPRWDRPEPPNRNGLWMEQWVERMLDSYSVSPTALNIVEGIYSQDGNGFGIGPHEPLGPAKVTSRDYMSNVNIFGLDPFRVDIVTHWLCGHEPGNFGLFHIGIERGLSDVLDPHDIPVYIWKDGQATLTKLDTLERTPIVTYYLQRDYNGQNEPEFHLCNEPFDYSMWKKGARVGDCSPSIKGLGRDNDRNIVMEVTVPNHTDAYVDVLDSKGSLIARLIAKDLEPGVHQVVWDGFASPGLYNYYVKGMGWDAVTQEVILS